MFYCTMSERPWEGRMMSGLCQGMQQGKVPCSRETGTTSRTYRPSLLVNVNGFGLEDGRASCRDDSKSLSFWICNEKKIFFFFGADHKYTLLIIFNCSSKKNFEGRGISKADGLLHDHKTDSWESLTKVISPCFCFQEVSYKCEAGTSRL